jgi:hypothetical protein
MPAATAATSGTRCCAIPRSWRSVRPDAFDLYAQQYVLFESVWLSIVHAKVRAVESAAGIRSADLLLEHGMLDAFEGIYGERDGLIVFRNDPFQE